MYQEIYYIQYDASLMKDVGTLPSHLTDKDVSPFHELESPGTVRTFHLWHELGQSLLQSESRYAAVLPTYAVGDTSKYTKMQI